MNEYTFTIAIYDQKKSKEYDNTSVGILSFMEDYKEVLPHSLCILETTGGYELEVLYTLCLRRYPVHRADTRKVKNFIRSFGTAAKTDSLDAKALAFYFNTYQFR